MKWLASAQLCHASVRSPPAVDMTAASVLVISVSSGFDFTITSRAGRSANSSRNGATPMNLAGFAVCTIADNVPLTALPVGIAAVTSTCVSPVRSRRSWVKNSAVRSDSVNGNETELIGFVWRPVATPATGDDTLARISDTSGDGLPR